MSNTPFYNRGTKLVPGTIRGGWFRLSSISLWLYICSDILRQYSISLPPNFQGPTCIWISISLPVKIHRRNLYLHACHLTGPCINIALRDGWVCFSYSVVLQTFSSAFNLALIVIALVADVTASSSQIEKGITATQPSATNYRVHSAASLLSPTHSPPHKCQQGAPPSSIVFTVKRHGDTFLNNDEMYTDRWRSLRKHASFFPLSPPL